MKRKTNTEFVAQLMDFAQTGSLMQAFVMTALEKYSAQILDAEQDDWAANGFISFEAWQASAREVRDSLDTHFKS